MDAPHKYTRRELYDLVWTTPIRRLAPTLGISDVALAKTCARHQVPTPGRGYWAKLQHGLIVERDPLPEPENEQAIEIRPPTVVKSQEKAEAEAPAIVVPARLTAPHPLVKTTAEAIRQQKPGRQSFVGTSARSGLLDLFVTSQQAGRALLILDTLLKAARERGWEVALENKERWKPRAYLDMGGSKAPLRLREIQKQIRGGNSVQDYVPTGRLELSFDLGFSTEIKSVWRDGRRQRVEDQLPKVMVALGQYEVKARRERLEREERARQRAEEERLRAEREAREREERARVDRLLGEVAAWHQAEQVRAYVENTQRRVRQAHGANLGERFEEWVSWALLQADRMDPLVQENG